MSGATPSSSRRPRVLVIVQNLAVPFDRRVWLECQSLVAAGYDVTRRLSHGTPTTTAYQVIDGVHDLHLPALRAGWQRAGLRRGVRLLVPGHGPAGPQGARGVAASTSSRRATRRTSSGRSRGCCAGATARGSSSTTTTCARSSTSPGSRGGGEPARTAACWPWSAGPSATADRVISTNESYREVAIAPRRQGARRRDRGAHRPGRATCCTAGEPDAYAAPRPPPPGRLPRRDGTAGRRRPRRPRGRSRDRARARPHRHRLHC